MAWITTTSRATSSSCATRRGVRLHMVMEVKIRIVGRKSEKWIEEAYAIYEKRLKPASIDVETEWHKTDDALLKGISSDQQKGHAVVLLDPNGPSYTSERFTTDFYKWMEQGGSRLVFVIGGAEGLPEEAKTSRDGKAPTLLSLSGLTFTHQFARLLLIEQVYRAAEIRKGSGYHK
jgi:23S rRNA (pseudouridine1915-N3)-methyltransferase